MNKNRKHAQKGYDMKTRKILAFTLPAALAAAFAASSFGFAGYAMQIHPQTMEEAWAWQKDHYDISWYEDTNPVEYTVKSYDGYVLHVTLMHSLQPRPASSSASPAAGSSSAASTAVGSSAAGSSAAGSSASSLAAGSSAASSSASSPAVGSSSASSTAVGSSSASSTAVGSSAAGSSADSSPARQASCRYVICSHGYTDNRYGTLKYAKIYLDLGYNVISYDLRGHGKNEKTFCTYTVREAQDLNALIEDTYKRYGENIELGLHGESLGAATSVAVLGYTQRPDFVVADCGFADIENVLKGGLRAMNPVLTFMLKPASLAAKIKYGYSFSQMRPIDALKDNQVPVLFIHGEDDTFIPPENSERMSKATKGYTELHLIPGAVHAKSILTEPDQYREYVTDFLRKL